MKVFWFVIVLVLLFVGSLFVLYDVIFSSNKKYMGDENSLPHGEQFDAYHETITDCVKRVLEVPFEEVEVSSCDGLILRGRYYHLTDEAPVVIFFHGYRCSGLRDGNGIFLYTRKLGYNVLLVDQRAHGKSEGKTITFGIMERYDCKSWVEYVVERFGKNIRIYLAGLSMGGATVLMASDIKLPKNVIGILADCPYSSPKEILCCVIKQMGFPVKMTYGLAKLSAKFLGRFDIEQASAIEAVKESELPTLILHGDDDRFVPCTMSIACQVAGEGHVSLKLIKSAGHGMSHCVDARSYEEAVYEFLEKTGGLS